MVHVSAIAYLPNVVLVGVCVALISASWGANTENMFLLGCVQGTRVRSRRTAVFGAERAREAGSSQYDNLGTVHVMCLFSFAQTEFFV